MEDQLPSVLNAGVELSLALLHTGADEEQLAFSELGQGQGVMEISDSAGSRKVLETRRGVWEEIIISHLNAKVQQSTSTPCHIRKCLVTRHQISIQKV